MVLNRDVLEWIDESKETAVSWLWRNTSYSTSRQRVWKAVHSLVVEHEHLLKTVDKFDGFAAYDTFLNSSFDFTAPFRHEDTSSANSSFISPISGQQTRLVERQLTSYFSVKETDTSGQHSFPDPPSNASPDNSPVKSLLQPKSPQVISMKLNSAEAQTLINSPVPRVVVTNMFDSPTPNVNTFTISQSPVSKPGTFFINQSPLSKPGTFFINQSPLSKPGTFSINQSPLSQPSSFSISLDAVIDDVVHSSKDDVAVPNSLTAVIDNFISSHLSMSPVLRSTESRRHLPSTPVATGSRRGRPNKFVLLEMKQTNETPSIPEHPQSADGRKKLKGVRRLDNTDDLSYCKLCFTPSDPEGMLGPLKVQGCIAVHEKCLYFSSNLAQTYDPEDPKTPQTSTICGFLIEDITKEIKRGVKLRCAFCRQTGASSGCNTRGCPRSFHLYCALRADAVCIFDGDFPLFCRNHRPHLSIPSWNPKTCPSLSTSCCVCLENIVVTKDTLGVSHLHGNCCVDAWVHRVCVSEYSNSAGLHHLKCPLCSDKKTFVPNMVRMGVWIPDRDAAWELEEGAFRDLYNNSKPPCSERVCICTEGREHHQSRMGASWYLIYCSFCLIMAAHKKCLIEAGAQMNNKRQPRYVCDGCSALAKREAKSSAQTS